MCFFFSSRDVIFCETIFPFHSINPDPSHSIDPFPDIVLPLPLHNESLTTTSPPTITPTSIPSPPPAIFLFDLLRELLSPHLTCQTSIVSFYTMIATSFHQFLCLIPNI